MNSITPFLWFENQAEEAAKFYVSLFKNSKILETRRYPENYTAVVFQLDGQKYIAFNGGPQEKLTPAFSFFVMVKTQRELDTLWAKLAKGGKPIACGWLTDRYGMCWQIIPEIMDKLMLDKDAAKAKRVWSAMIKMVKIDIKKIKEAAREP